VTLNPELPWQSGDQKEENQFHQIIRTKFNEDTTEILHLEHNFV
jgi:hypothetical protein